MVVQLDCWKGGEKTTWYRGIPVRICLDKLEQPYWFHCDVMQMMVWWLGWWKCVLMGRLNYQQWGCNQTKTLLRVISTLTYHPGIFSGILSVLPYFDILSSIPAGIYSDILADMCSGLPPSIRRCTLVQISRPDRDPHLAEITRFHQQVMGRVQLTSQSRFVRRRSAMQRLDAIGTDMVTRKIWKIELSIQIWVIWFFVSNTKHVQ